jgi:hypothetical protein
MALLVLVTAAELAVFDTGGAARKCSQSPEERGMSATSADFENFPLPESDLSLISFSGSSCT